MGWVSTDIFYQEITWTLGQLGMMFQIVSRHGQRWHLTVCRYADGPTFLKCKLVGVGVDIHKYIRIQDYISGLVPIHMIQDHLPISLSIVCKCLKTFANVFKRSRAFLAHVGSLT